MISVNIVWVLTIIIGVIILFVCMVAFKNFRRLVYGLPVVGGLFIIYAISKTVASSTIEGNYGSFKALCWIIGMMIVSMVVGKFVESANTFEKIEKYFADDPIKITPRIKHGKR